MPAARKIGPLLLAFAILVFAGVADAGAGAAPYSFRSDGQGKGSYESPLSESPFGTWSMIMVVRHPAGDPADMKNMAPALSAGIPAKP